MGGSGLLAASGGAAVGIIIYLVVIVFEIAALWRTFEKAGAPGWAAIIPIYNAYVLLKIVGRPGWWVVLFFIPLIGLIFEIIVANDLSKSFGRGAGFTVGLVLLWPIFVPILGFGASRYVGPAARPSFQGQQGGAYGAGSFASGGGSFGGQPVGQAEGYGYVPTSSGPTSSGARGWPSASDTRIDTPAAAPADWYADPTGKHQLRYWNGYVWTEHVSDSGNQSTDAL